MAKAYTQQVLAFINSFASKERHVVHKTGFLGQEKAWAVTTHTDKLKARKAKNLILIQKNPKGGFECNPVAGLTLKQADTYIEQYQKQFGIYKPEKGYAPTRVHPNYRTNDLTAKVNANAFKAAINVLSKLWTNVHAMEKTAATDAFPINFHFTANTLTLFIVPGSGYKYQLEIPAQCSGGGFSGATFGKNELVKLKAMDGELSLELDATHLGIKSGNDKFGAERFTEMCGLQVKGKQVAAHQFTEAEIVPVLNRVKKAIQSPDATFGRQALLCVHFKDNYLETCDGYRIHRGFLPKTTDLTDMCAYAYEVSTALDIIKGKNTHFTMVQYDDAYTIHAETGSVKFSGITARSSVSFLNTDQVFDNQKDCSFEYTIKNTKAFASELKKVFKGESEEGRPKRLIICECTTKGIYLTNQDTKEVSGLIAGEFGGEVKDDFRIAFNKVYLKDLVDALGTGSSTWAFMTPLTPLIAQSEHAKVMLLPVRVQP